MGGGDLNLKKSWHPQTLRNVEKVWKAEQKHEAERKKIEELQRELREERAREEMQRYAEDVGAVKKKDEKLDWMYQGPGGMVNREEYLMGRPVDKYVFQTMDDKEAGCSSETGLLPGSIFAQTGANSALDIASKIREDPLFMIRKREEEKKREVLNNPVKMKKIKELLQSSLEKKEKKKKRKEKKKKHKKHRHHSPSSSEDEQSKAKYYEKTDSLSLESLHPKISGYGLQVRGDGLDRKLSYKPSKSSRSESKCLSPQKYSDKTSKCEAEYRRPRSPLGNTKQHNSKEEKARTARRSPLSKKEGYRRQQASGYTRNLSAEELEQKRQEMMANAKWREEERANNVKKHRKEEAREKELEKLDRRDGKFIHHIKLESASTSSLEERVKRNIHSIQRTPAALEKNFMRR
ncbi:pre-mRNA-splicing factor CWC25 homolog isoform X1 [Eublepharis macularius]|uniref:Pre-mRNA-splicing factor CWC25 homolog isoform X1 n=1 Tax=Eublepharis macularius TaxID=481883 RepID=A0AA97KAH6_EUBMA|nr:pre-mRNA-splicing factor CWC25 homolog isoform X1 [Eublepharis macularius]